MWKEIYSQQGKAEFYSNQHLLCWQAYIGHFAYEGILLCWRGAVRAALACEHTAQINSLFCAMLAG